MSGRWMKNLVFWHTPSMPLLTISSKISTLCCLSGLNRISSSELLTLQISQGESRDCEDFCTKSSRLLHSTSVECTIMLTLELKVT